MHSNIIEHTCIYRKFGELLVNPSSDNIILLSFKVRHQSHMHNAIAQCLAFLKFGDSNFLLTGNMEWKCQVDCYTGPPHTNCVHKRRDVKRIEGGSG